MKTYFIGTTLEGLITILKNQSINANSLKDTCLHTEDKIHLIPTKVTGRKRKELLTYAIENSSSLISELNHTRRIILEVKGICDSYISEVEGNTEDFVKLYQFYIPVSDIKRYYIEKNDMSEKIKGTVALSDLTKSKNTEYIQTLQKAYYSGQDIKSCNIPINNIEFLDLSLMFNFYEDLYDCFLNLSEEINKISLFKKKTFINILKI